MNVNHFRNLIDYHLTLNRQMWDNAVVSLTDEEFKRELAYSIGSIRNQVVHMLNIDERWFCGLRNEEIPGFEFAKQYTDHDSVRTKWDAVETMMRDTMQNLTDEQLYEEAIDDKFLNWQLLFHVVNHGTDHRAQVMAMIHTLGKTEAVTFPQDYFYFARGIDITAETRKKQQK